jgi:hypothetical protein
MPANGFSIPAQVRGLNGFAAVAAGRERERSADRDRAGGMISCSRHGSRGERVRVSAHRNADSNSPGGSRRNINGEVSARYRPLGPASGVRSDRDWRIATGSGKRNSVPFLLCKDDNRRNAAKQGSARAKARRAGRGLYAIGLFIYCMECSTLCIGCTLRCTG